MDEGTCTACGRPIHEHGCACGATWPSARRTWTWLAVGLLLLPVSAAAAYGGVVLARRTVLERPSLGPEATATGAVLVGLAALVALVGPAALRRAWGRFRARRRTRVETDPSRSTRVADRIDGVGTRLGAVPQRTPNAVALGAVAAGSALWVVSYVAAAHLPRSAFVAVTLLAWVLVPLGVVFDSGPLSRGRWWAATSLVPFLAALVGAGYLSARLRTR